VSDPEIDTVTLRENESLIYRSQYSNDNFTLHECLSSNLRDAISIYRDLLKSSRDSGHELFQFVPLGPKRLILAFAYLTASGSDIPIDIVYPAPAKYSSNYSLGIGSTQVDVISFGVSGPTIAEAGF
jgi:hypothetical protein